MDKTTIDIDQLATQSGLPAYMLEQFDRIGIFEESEQEPHPTTSFSEKTRDLAKQIADMRSLGFSFGQIISILEPA